MKVFWIIPVCLVVLVILTSYICYRMAFFANRKRIAAPIEFDLPPGEIYEPYHPMMIKWIKEVRAMPHKEFTIRSFDGLKLFGRYYEYAPGAPIELMFHGYRGNAERDLCGGVQRCFDIGHSILVVDQRCSGNSEGHVISFGINESKDCRSWVDFMIGYFGDDVQIILTGISMGAATVMMAAGRPLPKNVVGVLADCGYTSAREIIQTVIAGMKLPPKRLYPFVRLGARLFGGFALEETSPIEAMKTCTIPIVFAHGEDDAFVPCEMSRQNYAACTAPKRLITVPGAGHGLAYPADPERYLEQLALSFTELGVPAQITTQNNRSN